MYKKFLITLITLLSLIFGSGTAASAESAEEVKWISALRKLCDLPQREKLSDERFSFHGWMDPTLLFRLRLADYEVDTLSKCLAIKRYEETKGAQLSPGPWEISEVDWWRPMGKANYFAIQGKCKMLFLSSDQPAYVSCQNYFMETLKKVMAR